MSQEQQPADPSNPLGIEQLPNLRWTFSACPNSANPTSSSQTAAAANNDTGVGAKLRNAITGGGAGSSASEEGTASHPPPLPPETVIPLACMYTPMHDHATPVLDEATGEPVASGEVQGYMPRVVGPLGKAPPQCKTCHTFLNKHIAVDGATRVWACPCCFTRNTLQPHEAAALAASSGDGSVDSHPILQYATVEYLLSGGEQPMTPVFLFVVDVCVDTDELEAMKQQLLRSLEWLPADARVGFMTFGHGITLWELGCGDVNRCYSFRGTRRYTKGELQAMLGLPKMVEKQQQQQQPTGSPNTPSTPATGKSTTNTTSTSNTSNCAFPGSVQDRFLCALSDCDFALNSIVDDIKGDPFTVPVGHRPQRATGAALEIAVTLLELVADSHFGKVLLFCGGPCTRGPGSVADPKRAVLMRGHKDLQEGNAPLFEPAVAFYRELEVRLTRTTSSLDTFIFSLDQVGLLELRSCVNNTGGMVVMGDKFQNAMFGTSLQRYFERSSFGKDESSRMMLEHMGVFGDESMGAQSSSHVVWTRGHCSGFGLDVRCNTSPETKIMGCLGHCRAADYATLSASAAVATAGTHNKNPTQQQQGALNNVSPHRIGASGTNRWLTSSADSSLTLCFVFDTDCPITSEGRKRFVQIITRYHATNGEVRARVTSVAMPIAPSGGNAPSGQNPAVNFIQQYNTFDQECAAVVVARMAVSLMERSDNSRFETVRRWIDRMLVRFCRKFGTYALGSPDSLRIPPGFSLFPAFLFNFRRSEYFMVLNISPDESTFKRHFLMRETCDNCTIMVQPVLYSYSLDEPFAQPAPLDVDSIKIDNILLIDAFFNVHVMYGVTIEEWATAGYQEQEDFAHFKALLEVPQRDADAILEKRMPYPWFSVTGRWGGDSRHFLNRFSAGGKAPSAAGKQTSGDGGTLFTEDASMQKFMSSLKSAVVMPENEGGK